MIVYIEDTLIENFLITYIILYIIFSFIKENKNKFRIIAASVFGAFVAFLYPIINLNSFLILFLKLCMRYIITLIAYKNKSLKKQIFFYVMFIFITAIYGGINLLIYFSIYGNFESSRKLPTLLIIFSVFLITYFIKQCEKVIYSKKNINNFIYEIIITINEKKIKTKGYLDTGNILCDTVYKKPVVLINYKMFSKINKNFPIQNFLTQNTQGLKKGHYIKVKTATSNDMLLAFCVDSLEIILKDKTVKILEPVFALSKIKITGFDCDVILNSKLLC